MHVRILRIGASARSFKADEAAFAALVSRAPRYAAARLPGPKAFFDDPDKLLPSDPPRAVNFNFKLGNFERATGQRVFARVFAKSPANPETFTRELARALGVEADGVLAVYFADADKWKLNIGPALRGKFAGKTAKSASNAESLDNFFTDTKKREAIYTTQTAAALPNYLQIPGQRIKISTDAVVDELLLKIIR
jgi:hypothetical protein